MLAIGLVNPAEETMRRLVAVIASTPAYASFTGPQLHGMLLEFKQALATVRRSAVAQHARIVSFPVRSMDLPADVYNAAYPDDPPIDAQAANQTGFATRAYRPHSYRSEIPNSIVASPPRVDMHMYNARANTTSTTFRRTRFFVGKSHQQGANIICRRRLFSQDSRACSALRLAIAHVTSRLRCGLFSRPCFRASLSA